MEVNFIVEYPSVTAESAVSFNQALKLANNRMRAKTTIKVVGEANCKIPDWLYREFGEFSRFAIKAKILEHVANIDTSNYYWRPRLAALGEMVAARVIPNRITPETFGVHENLLYGQNAMIALALASEIPPGDMYAYAHSKFPELDILVELEKYTKCLPLERGVLVQHITVTTGEVDPIVAWVGDLETALPLGYSCNFDLLWEMQRETMAKNCIVPYYHDRDLEPCLSAVINSDGSIREIEDHENYVDADTWTLVGRKALERYLSRHGFFQTTK